MMTRLHFHTLMAFRKIMTEHFVVEHYIEITTRTKWHIRQ